ncbi:hypothetical protein C8Q77DRAFT_1074440 [Trametes polyzona]|nr:hypothetical protein C8Q77DRAFT_1074440 [Trametes polyzona]
MNALVYLFALAYLTIAALGQRIAIGAPAEWSTFAPGSNITVEVDRPMTLTGSQEVAIAIGLWPCAGYGDAANRTCAEMDVTQVLGDVLYAGPYAPKLPQEPSYKPPHQNFTITIPPNFATGQASLGVAHFAIIGVGLSSPQQRASSMPFMEVVNMTVLIQ